MVMRQVALLEESGINAPGLDRVAQMFGIEHHPASDRCDAEDHIRNILAAPVDRVRSGNHKARGASRSVEVERQFWKSKRCASHTPRGQGCSMSLAHHRGRPIHRDRRPERSGKTTLAKMAGGSARALIPARVLLEGRDRTSCGRRETAREIGYVFQNPDHQIFADTVEAEVKFGPRNFGLDDDEVEIALRRRLAPSVSRMMRDQRSISARQGPAPAPRRRQRAGLARRAC